MRFAERFLVVLALISLVMRYWGLKDGPTMELIAMPVLAGFYILCMPFVLRSAQEVRLRALAVLISILSGIALGYCIISLMLYTLGWIPKADMLVNCSLLLGILIAAAIAGRRKAYLFQAGVRALALLLLIWIVQAYPPQVRGKAAAISHATDGEGVGEFAFPLIGPVFRVPA